MRKKGAETGHVQFILIERVHFFLNRTRLLFSKLNMFTFSKSGHVHFFVCGFLNQKSEHVLSIDK